MRTIKKLILLFFSCTLMFLTGSYRYDNPLLKVKNFTIYYDHVDDKILQHLSSFDLVIIEPHAFNKEQVLWLKDQNVIVLGYMSLMELENWNVDFVKKVIEEDYYYQNNEKIYIEKWDTYIMDISKEHYQSLLLAEIQEEIVDKQLDGVFFDTIGDIDDYFLGKDPLAVDKLRKGYVRILNEMKVSNPELLLVQNWGFETFKAVSNPYVDGLLWENFREDLLANSDWGQNWIGYFKQVEKERKVAIFTVSPTEKDQTYSKSFRFTSFINKDDYYNDIN